MIQKSFDALMGVATGCDHQPCVTIFVYLRIGGQVVFCNKRKKFVGVVLRQCLIYLCKRDLIRKMGRRASVNNRLV